MRCLFLACVLLVLDSSDGSAGQHRNTISQAYIEAFSNPTGFETFVLFDVDDAFPGKFAQCAQVATPVLVAIEKNLRQEYAGCDENSVCVAIAKQIAVVVEARENVRALADYFDAMRREKDFEFEHSEAGQRAFGPFETMKRMLGVDDAQATALMRRIPAFQGVINTLGALPCQ